MRNTPVLRGDLARQQIISQSLKKKKRVRAGDTVQLLECLLPSAAQNWAQDWTLMHTQAGGWGVPGYSQFKTATQQVSG